MRNYFLPILFAVFGITAAHGQDLQQVYDLALSNDAQLRAARASRDSTMEAKPQARAQLLPSLTLSASGDQVHRRVHNTAAAGSDDYSTASATVSLSQPIIRIDRWMALSQAGEVVEQAEIEYSAAEQELMVRTAQAYFDILASQDNLKFAEAETKAIARQLDQAKQRFDVGLIAITDVHEAQAAYDQSRSDLIAAKRELDDAWEALREITKERVTKVAVLAEELPLTKPTPADVEAWSHTAMQNSLAIQSAQKDVEIAKDNVHIERAGHWPTLDLVGSHTASRTELDGSADTDISRVGVEFTLPLFAGGNTVSRTRQAQYDLEAAQETLDGERRSVDRQVRDAYRGVLSSISQVKALKASTVSAQSALEATEAGFEVGTRTMVDVLESQRDLYRTLSSYASTRYNYILSGLQLKQAAGTLTRQDLLQVNSWLR